MCVEKTFSRFGHSFTLGGSDHDFKIGFIAVRPGLYLDKRESIAFNRYYIDFPPACPPVSRDYPESARNEVPRGLLLARKAGFPA